MSASAEDTDESGRVQSSYRIDPKLYHAFKTKCATERRYANDVLVQMIEQYVKGKVVLK